MVTSKAKDDPGAGTPDADSAGPVTGADGTEPAAGPAAGPADDPGSGGGTPSGAAAPAGPAPQPSEPGAPAAAPVTAPAARKVRTPDPAKTVEPSAAMREAPGSHVALVDHDGNELGPNALFTDQGAHMTHVLTSQRIYQRFRYPGTNTVTTQLLYPANARVPRDHAERVKATLLKSTAAGAGGEVAG